MGRWKSLLGRECLGARLVLAVENCAEICDAVACAENVSHELWAGDLKFRLQTGYSRVRIERVTGLQSVWARCRPGSSHRAPLRFEQYERTEREACSLFSLEVEEREGRSVVAPLAGGGGLHCLVVNTSFSRFSLSFFFVMDQSSGLQVEDLLRHSEHIDMRGPAQNLR